MPGTAPVAAQPPEVAAIQVRPIDGYRRGGSPVAVWVGRRRAVKVDPVPAPLAEPRHPLDLRQRVRQAAASTTVHGGCSTSAAGSIGVAANIVMPRVISAGP